MMNRRTPRATKTGLRAPTLVLSIVTACVPALARQAGSPAAAFDEASGRSLLNYPVRSGVDVLNVRLEIAIADMNAPRLEATQTMEFRPLGWPADELRLRSPGLKITSVRSPDRRAEFVEQGGSLTISLSPPVPVGVSASVVISFLVADPTDHKAWTTESGTPSGRAALLNTSLLDVWYPRTLSGDCATSDISIDVPFGYLACAPGRLVSRSKATSRASTESTPSSIVGPREVFRWTQDAEAGGEHCGRLDVVVGKFDVVDVGSSSVPVPVYAPIGRGPDARATFASVSRMIDVFAKRFGARYPWPKLAPIVFPPHTPANVGSGSETTPSMAFFTEDVLSRSNSPRDGEHEIARTLGRQWFGGLLCARSPEHRWLADGFSTYAISLWLESSKNFGGQSDSDDELVRGWFNAAIAASVPPGKDAPNAPFTPALVSKAYAPGVRAAERPADPGIKGAAILHMLRQRLGDDVFFKGLSVYVNRFAHKTVETIDFRQAMEEVSGESLEQFFDQWCYRPGIPSLGITSEWDAASKELKVDVKQTQTINADNPAFAFALPIVIPDGTKTGRVSSVDVNSRVSTVSIPLESAPEFITIDPALSVLAAITITQPESAWVAQLSRGQSWSARALAARSLGASNSATARAVLAEFRDSPSTPESLKAEIRRALGQPGEVRIPK